MKLGTSLAFTAAFFALAGCEKAGSFKEVARTESVSADGTLPTAAGESVVNTTPVRQQLVPRQRAVIRKADVSVRVDKLGEAEKQLTNLVSSVGGYISGSASDNLSTDNPTSVFSLRVPSTKFDEVMGKIEALGTPTNRSITTDDVTGQVIDLEARMRALRAQEQAILGLFSRAHSLKDTLTVREQLTQVRTETERLQAMHQELSGLASMSTIRVTLNQSAVTTAKADDPNWAQEAWGSATTSAGKSMREFAKVGINLVVFSPFWVPIALAIWWGSRKLIHAANNSPAQTHQ